MPDNETITGGGASTTGSAQQTTPGPETELESAEEEITINDVPLPAQIFDVAKTNDFLNDKLDYFQEMHKTTKRACIRN